MRSLVEILPARKHASVIWSHWAMFLYLSLAFPPLSASAQVAAAKPSDIRAHLQRAQDSLKANDTDTAAKEFRAVLAADPKNAEAHLNLGVIEMFQGNCQSASQDFRRALAVQPSLARAKALQGICARRLGDRGAKALLQSSFSKLTETNLRTQVGMELVSLYYHEGDPDRAAVVVKKLVDLNPDNVDILYTAQRLYTELADDTLNKLAILGPGSARMQQVIAERLINADDLQGAIVHYRKALEINPRLPGVHYELAEAIWQVSPSDPKTQAEAEKEIEAAAEVDGQNPKTECLLGRIATLRSDLEHAHGHYSRALAINPRDVEAQVGLGRTLAMMGKPQEAIKPLSTAVQADPLNGEAHYRLAIAYRRLQRTQDAEKEMRLFQEIKQTKEQVKALYRQMNKQVRSQDEEMVGPDQ